MNVYKVQHKTAAEHCYYTLASSKAEAVERVTLAIEDAEGTSAWAAEPDAPAFSITKGTVHDRHGRPIKTLEL